MCNNEYEYGQIFLNLIRSTQTFWYNGGIENVSWGDGIVYWYDGKFNNEF